MLPSANTKSPLKVLVFPGGTEMGFEIGKSLAFFQKVML
jgi:hypothetical protein